MAPQREWFEKDYYAVLGVPQGATQKEVTRAYRKLAKEHHPDTNPGHDERFKEISAAYDVIGDESTPYVERGKPVSQIALAVRINTERELICLPQHRKLLSRQQVFVEVLELSRAFDPDVTGTQSVL